MPGYGNYRTGVVDGTDPSPGKIPGAFNNGSKKVFVEKFDLSKANVLKTAGAGNYVAKIPEGHAIMSIKVSSSVSLTTSTLSFGSATVETAVTPAKAYGTTAEAVIEYVTTAQRAALRSTGIDLYMFGQVATLPGVGIIVVEIETVTTG